MEMQKQSSAAEYKMMLHLVSLAVFLVPHCGYHVNCLKSGECTYKLLFILLD